MPKSPIPKMITKKPHCRTGKPVGRPKGRPKGKQNSATIEARERMQKARELAMNEMNLTEEELMELAPVDVMLLGMKIELKTKNFKAAADYAMMAAPYVHARLASVENHNFNDDSKRSDEELAREAEELAARGAAGPDSQRAPETEVPAGPPRLVHRAA